MTHLFTVYYSKIDDQIEIKNFAIEGYLRIFCAYLQNN